MRRRMQFRPNEKGWLEIFWFLCWVAGMVLALYAVPLPPVMLVGLGILTACIGSWMVSQL